MMCITSLQKQENSVVYENLEFASPHVCVDISHMFDIESCICYLENR